ncbi:hemolysin-type calcium binding protein [Leptolyngbya sp. NIES-2104]|nr:hemolysin-type calcium binding protein [Leptolyngbya sp. NIES-2104]
MGPTLNPDIGFNLRFDLQLLQEARNSNADNNLDGRDDRAGLSILVVSNDRARAIELGFFADRVWAQNDGATKADPVTNPMGTRFTQSQTEFADFTTNTAINRYDLSFLGSTYYLYANGNYTTPLFSGLLRDYRQEAIDFPGPASAVYNTSNFIFIGDNTTSARGSFRLNQVELSPAITPIPFAFNPLFGFGVFGLSRLRKAIAKK